MEDRLPTVGSAVRDQAITSFVNPFIFGKFSRRGEEMPYKLFVLCFQCCDRFDVLVRDDQNMRRRDGMSISKGCDLFIAVEDRSVGFTRNDFAENAGICHF